MTRNECGESRDSRPASRIRRLTIRLPAWLSPLLSAREEPEKEPGRVRVSVSLDAPLLGRLITYCGTIEVAASS